MSRLRSLFLVTSALLPLGLTSAHAGPNGATVVGGAATVQGQGTASVVVNQTSQNAIINWQTFNIGAGESTKITMPGASSVELDRVTGGLGPSQILGSLFSNGRVFLVNPDGILFGQGAKVNVGGLLATTHDIANSDFMAGRYNFAIPGMPNASIVNEGSITAQTGGFAALVAPGVRNTGTITATLGQVGLASANTFALDFYGDRLIQLNLGDAIASQVVDVSTGQPLKSLVSNEGMLKADGGRVELTAVAARQVVDSVINNTGVVEANTIGTHNGMIVLGAATGASKPEGAPIQTVKVSGTLSAAGKRKGTSGGTIEVTGENVQVSGANIDASGVSGGGAVLIGGDWGGGHPNTSLVSNPSTYLEPYNVPNSTTVSVDAASKINASATETGNGGKVIVWSNETTTFYGTILAQGGVQSGNGGFVETSGHQLSFNGSVDTSAPNGIVGTLLLDPLNATIAATAGSEIITTSSIENALGTGDVVVTTVGTTGNEAGDITFASSLSWANANTLTLNAYRDVDINSGVTVTNTGAGNLVLRADATGNGVGTVNFNGTARLDFSGSTGTVSILYNPADNPGGSVVNATSYTTPFDYSPNVLTNSAVPSQLTAYMLVNSIYDLQNIQNNLSGDYALGTNIDASGTASWNSGEGFVPIGSKFVLEGPSFELQSFVGLFDGQGHTIDKLTIDRQPPPSIFANLVGLFGSVGAGGVVRNIGVTNANVVGNELAGVLAGTNTGTIANSFASGLAQGGGATGGLVAQNVGMISSSHAAVTVTSTETCGGTCSIGGLVGENITTATNTGTILSSYATGAVATSSSGFNLGGLVGLNEGNVGRSYATGDVTGDQQLGGLVGYNVGTISQSYATGKVTETLYSGQIGGLVGENNGSITESYATGETTATDPTVPNFAGGLVGVNNSVGLISQSYAVGLVDTAGIGCCSPSVGGLIGFNSNSSPSGVLNSYWNTDTAGQPTSAGGTGLPTTQFKSGLPSGFDPTVWGSNSAINNGYPYLLWQSAGSTPPSSPTTLTPSALQLITVSAEPETKTYGSPDPALAYQITSGSLSGSDAFSGSLTRATGENVGSYAIGEGTLALPPNYELTFLGSALIINPAPLVIGANNASRQVGNSNPSFTASYSGFVAGDGPSVVSGLVLSTPATPNSSAGAYPIIPSGASAQNYTISYVDGVLTLTPATILPPGRNQINPILTANFSDTIMAESTPAVTLSQRNGIPVITLNADQLGTLYFEIVPLLINPTDAGSLAVEKILEKYDLLPPELSLNSPSAGPLILRLVGTVFAPIEWLIRPRVAISN